MLRWVGYLFADPGDILAQCRYGAVCMVLIPIATALLDLLTGTPP